jgi:hypothetical protein
MSGQAGRTPLPGTLLLLALLAGPARAEQFRVPEDYASLATALAVADFGDTVSLAPGIHGEHSISWPPGRAILGRTGNPEDTVIDAQQQGRVLSGSDLVSVNELGYLTLRGGHGAGPYGSGLMAVGEPYLHDLIIEGCTAGGPLYGIGLYLRGGATLVDCVLRDNRSTAPGTEGGGAWLMGSWAGDLYVENLDVYGNEAALSSGIHFSGLHGYFTGVYSRDNAGDGMVIYNGSVNGMGPTVEYSFFESNAGAGIAYDADAIIRSCTFVGNGAGARATRAAIDGGSSWDFTLDPLITQCVVAFNDGPGIRGLKLTPYTIECNDVYGNAGGNYLNLPDLTGLDGNLSLDPQFCGQGGRPYGLERDSPCAADHNDCGLLLGAYAVECEDTPAARTSWGAVKARY